MGVAIASVDARTTEIIAGGVIAVLELERAEHLLPVAEAIRAGGVTAIEVTPTAPGVVQALGPARMTLGRDVVLGLGSVLTAEAARDALQAGAAFVAAPNLNPEVIRVCREARVPVIPGTFTATEIVQAWGLGASMVKVFPAGPVGAGYIREILVSQPDVRLVPTGGITLENVGDFIQAGAAAVGVGDEIVSKDLLAQRSFSEITRRARAFVEAVQRARGQVAQPMQPARPIEGPDVR